MTATALIKGVAGNLIEIGETLAHSTSKWASDATKLSGGVDGTAARAGTQAYEATKHWIAVTDTTISDTSGWKYSSLE